MFRGHPLHAYSMSAFFMFAHLYPLPYVYTVLFKHQTFVGVSYEYGVGCLFDNDILQLNIQLSTDVQDKSMFHSSLILQLVFQHEYQLRYLYVNLDLITRKQSSVYSLYFVQFSDMTNGMHILITFLSFIRTLTILRKQTIHLNVQGLQPFLIYEIPLLQILLGRPHLFSVFLVSPTLISPPMVHNTPMLFLIGVMKLTYHHLIPFLFIILHYLAYSLILHGNYLISGEWILFLVGISFQLYLFLLGLYPLLQILTFPKTDPWLLHQLFIQFRNYQVLIPQTFIFILVCILGIQDKPL